ncbi:MAG: phosphatidylcholine/phosphatidylserine synthase [Methylacidiphilales bacterium]|nr:phosphatidylcholine/phosphatidylserine synthase [Candidatus Methylacidiphilales bacterium]
MNNLSGSRKRQVLFWLPNSITLLALFFGFQCIVSVVRAQYEIAIYFMLLAMIADFIDGRIARWLNVQSDFGASFDSISDTIAFALAPALLMHQWILSSLANYGFKPFFSWAIAFSYLASGAFRLARFTSVTVVDKRFFQGLPSPIAALTVASFVGLSIEHQWSQEFLIVPSIVITLVLGFLMVSKFPYYSFKDLRLNNRVQFGGYLFLAALLVLILQTLYEYALYDTIFLVTLIYITSPFILYLRRSIKRPSAS